MVGTSHYKFWQDVLLATRLLWIHSERSVELFPYTDEILDFMREDMALALTVSSWVQPMLYVLNDLADPAKDIPKLLDFIDSHLIDWNDNKLIEAYRNHVGDLYEKYMIECEA